jgi:hypothetical protein
MEMFQKMCKAAMAEGEERHTHRHQDRGQLLGKRNRNRCKGVVFGTFDFADPNVPISTGSYCIAARPGFCIP